MLETPELVSVGVACDVDSFGAELSVLVELQPVSTITTAKEITADNARIL
jgi:hypothetical protein